MPKGGVSLAEHLTEFKVCAQELLSVKVKRQIGSNRSPIKITARIFLPIKAREIPTVGLPSHCLTWGAQNCQNLMRTRLVYQRAKNVP